MTVVAVWCRHKGDNLIGIDNRLPWNILSDAARFREIVQGKNVVCGRKTYESLPERKIGDCPIFVMTSHTEYEVSDDKLHQVIGGQKALADLEEDLYVAGGAEIYLLFLTGKEKLKPHIVVDCVYEGNVAEQAGEKIDITESVALLEKKYRKITPDYCLDNVAAAIWLKKGEFVEQSVLKRILEILERGAVVR